MKPRLSAPLRAVLLALAGTAGGILLAEAGARLLYLRGAPEPRPHLAEFDARPSFSPRIVFDLDPNGHDVNVHGFRHGPLPFAKPAGTRRVFVLGDSMTYGPGLPAGRTYPAVLESLLGGPDAGIEVVNCAVPLYDIHQERAVLEEKVLAFEPDLVILGFYFNDLILSDWRRNPATGRLSARMDRLHNVDLPRVFPEGLDRLFLRRWYAYPILAVGAYELAKRTPLLSRHAAELPFVRANDVLAEEAFDGIARLLAARGVPWMVVNLVPADHVDGYERDDFAVRARRWLGRVAAKHRVPLLDLHPVLGARRPEELLLPDRRGDRVHLNALGHRLAAEAVATFLRERPELLGRP